MLSAAGALDRRRKATMTAAQHRTRSAFSLPIGWAALITIGIGVLSGVVVASAAIPDTRAIAAGTGYGLLVGVLAAVGVAVVRRAIQRGTRYRRAVTIAVLAVAGAAGVLFAVIRLAPELTLVGVPLGAWTALVATFVGLRRERR